MASRGAGVVTVILGGVGLILLLAAAFDILPMPDNQVIFMALACFIVAGIIKKVGGGCCK